MTRKGVGLGLGFAVVLLVGSSARPARADWDMQLGASMAGGWLREAPDFESDPVSTTARDIGEGRLRSRGGRALIGLQADAELTIDDRWKVPLFGLGYAWAVGSYPTTLTTLDGSVARTQDWTTRRIDFLFPGIGRRWKHRRYTVQASIRTGVSWMAVDGSVAAGGQNYDLENLGAVTFLAQAEIEGCRRIDPTTRVCLQLIPRLYEHTWLNGGTLGVRVEWGR